MEIAKYNEYGKWLEDSMKLRSYPIAIKWFEHASDVPDDVVFPKKAFGKHMAVCQAFSYARMKGMAIGLTTEDHWCWNPLIGFGNVECVPGQPQFDEVIKYISIPDLDKAAEFFKNFPRLPLGKYEAFVVAPLKKAKFVPDVVCIYAEVAKVNHLVRCVKSATGNYITSVFDGIDSCIYCTVPSFLKNEYRITLPDPGDRERALARDDEIILTVPGGRMEEFMTSVEAAQKFMPFGDRMLEIELDFGHPPFYNTLFDIWGLDKGREWDY